MFTIDSVACIDSFPTDGQTGGAQIIAQGGSSGGYFSVANFDAYAQLGYVPRPGPPRGGIVWTPQFHVTVGNGILAAGTHGIRFRNYTPGLVALVSAALSEPYEPPVQLAASGSAQPQTVAMQLIQTQLLTAAANAVTFQNIPQTFTHLLLVVHAQSVGAFNFEGQRLRFNGDGGNNYDETTLDGSGPPAAVATAANANVNGGVCGVIAAAAGGALNELSTYEVLIGDYRNPSLPMKSWKANGSCTTSVGGILQWFNRQAGGVWHPGGPGSPISALTVYNISGNNYSAGAGLPPSIFSLYGL